MLDIESYERYSPLSAALAGRDENAQKLIYEKFNRLPDEVTDILVDVSTADKIQQWEQQGMFPPTHSSAVAKLVALVVLGEVSSSQVSDLLSKLNLDAASVQKTTEAIASIAAPAMSYLQGLQSPASLGETELPPLTVQRSAANQPELPPNVVDLRQRG